MDNKENKTLFDKIIKNVNTNSLEAPFSVAFTVTRKCNYLCRHCYNNSGASVNEEMTDEELINVAHQIADLHPTDVCLCGGEPLIRGDIIYDIIDILIKDVGSVSIVSNGFLIDLDTAKRLKEHGINTLQISLDGNTEFLHNFMRMNSKAYSRAISAIKYGVESGLNVAVSCCPNKLNINHIEEICELTNSLGATEIRLMPLILMGRGSQMGMFQPSADEYLVLQQKIKQLNDKYTKMTVEWGDPVDHLYRMPSNGEKNITSFSMEIRSNGKLSISSYLPIVVGDVREHTLKEYWNAGFNHIWGNKEILKLVNGIYSTSQISNFNPMAYTEKDIEVLIPV